MAKLPSSSDSVLDALLGEVVTFGCVVVHSIRLTVVLLIQFRVFPLERYPEKGFFCNSKDVCQISIKKRHRSLLELQLFPRKWEFNSSENYINSYG